MVLSRGPDFDTLAARLQRTLVGDWVMRHVEGRRMASAQTVLGEVVLVDGHDDLGHFLSDDHAVLEIGIASEASFSPAFESAVRDMLETAQMAWTRGVWSRLSRDESTREIWP